MIAGEAGGGGGGGGVAGGVAQPLAVLGGDTKVKYVSWDFKKLLDYFRREPAVAGKVMALLPWAVCMLGSCMHMHASYCWCVYSLCVCMCM